MNRGRLFHLLGVCLRQQCIASFKLDVPGISTEETRILANAFASGERSARLSSLVLTTDCRRGSWAFVEKIFRLVGRNLVSLEIGINGGEPLGKIPKTILSLCPQLHHLKLHRLQLSKQNPLVAHLHQPASHHRSLALPRLQAPLQVISDLSRTLANRTRPCCLESLHLDLSDIANVSDESVEGVASALHQNDGVRAVTLVLDSDAAAALTDPAHDAFYDLHNERIVEPLSGHSRVAFLSVFSASSDWQTHPPLLNPLPLALIFQFAGTQSRRCVRIQEPGAAW